MLSIHKVIAIANSPQVFRVNRSAYINTHYLKRIEKKTRICYLSHHELTLETKIKRSNLSYFEKLNCCPVD